MNVEEFVSTSDQKECVWRRRKSDSGDKGTGAEGLIDSENSLSFSAMTISDRLVPAGKGTVIAIESAVWVHENGHTRSSSIPDFSKSAAEFVASSAPMPPLEAEVDAISFVGVLEGPASDGPRNSSAAKTIHPSPFHLDKYGKSVPCKDQFISNCPGESSTAFSMVGLIDTSIRSKVLSCLLPPPVEGDGRERIMRQSEADIEWEARSKNGVSRSYLAVNFPENGSVIGDVRMMYIEPEPVEIAQWVSSSSIADGYSGS